MESATDQRKKFWSAVSSGVYFENNGYIRVHKRYIDNVGMEYKNNIKFNRTAKKRTHKIESYSRYRIFFRNYVYQYVKVISPHNRYKIYWDCVNIIVLCFSCLFIPFFVGFRLKISPEIYSIFIVLDFINFIDLCLNFKTAYYNKSLDNYEYDPYKISLQYLKFWFWWDLLASIPTDLIINAILYNDSFHLEESPKALILLRLFYFLKLSRMHKFFELKNIFEEFQLNPILIDVQILAVRMTFISHLLACFWNFIATFDTESNTSYMITPAPPPAPVDHNTWVYVFHFSTDTLFDRYVASLYWSLTTMLTVGYGDIHAVNWGEQLFSIVAELLGVVIFGAIVARIVEILKNVNPQRQAVKAEISELMAYLGENQNIPASVKADAKSACVYFMNNKTTFSESEILEELQLPTDILADFIARGYTYQIHHFALFHDADVSFVADIVTRLKPFKTWRKQVLLHFDDVIDELVFVMTGSVQMITTTTTTTTTAPATETASSAKHPVSFPVILGQVSPGGYFGDMEYEKVCLSLVTYRTVGKSSLYSLSYVDLTSTLADSPQKCEDFYSICNEKYKKLQISFSSSVRLVDDGAAYKQLLWIDGEIKSYDEVCKPGSRLLALSAQDDDIEYTTIKYDKGKDRVVKAEETAAEINARWIIDPQNVNKLLWDVFTALLVLYSLLTMSITQTFTVESPSVLSKFDYAVNAIFFLDIAIVSRTAYPNSDGDLMTIPSKIFRRYLRGWFWLDLASSLPFDAITSNSSMNLSVLKLFKLFRLIRFFKLARVAEVVTWIEDRWPMAHGTIEIAKLMFSIILVSHIVACLWWVLADSSSSYTWFDVNALRDASITEQYIASLYWTVTTLTTVGYGDIIPSNSAERIIACFVMLLGGIAFGYIVGNMSSLLSNFDPTVAKVNDQTSRVRSFLEQKAFSNKFIGVVLKHLKNRLRHSSVFDEEAILSKLPTRITREILSYRHAETISSLRIFKYIPNRSVVLYLRNKIQPLFYQTDQLLFAEGDIPSGIIMITSGKTQRYSKIIPKSQSVKIMNTSVAFLQRISKKKSFSKSSKQLLISDFRTNSDVDDNNSNSRGRSQMSPTPAPASPSPSSSHNPSNNAKSKWQRKLLKLGGSTMDEDSHLQVKVLGCQETGDFLGIEELMESRSFRSSAKAMVTTSAFILTQSNINNMITDAPAIALILQQALINLIIDCKLSKAKKKRAAFTEKFVDDLKIQFKLSKVPQSAPDVAKRGKRRESWTATGLPRNKNDNPNESSIRKLSVLLGKQMGPVSTSPGSDTASSGASSTPKSIRYIFGTAAAAETYQDAAATSQQSAAAAASVLGFRNRPKIYSTAMEPSLPTVIEELAATAAAAVATEKLRVDSLCRASFSETKVEHEHSDNAIEKITGGRGSGSGSGSGSGGKEGQAAARSAIRKILASSAAATAAACGAPPAPASTAGTPSSSFAATVATATATAKSTIHVKEMTKSTRFVRMDYNELCNLLNGFVTEVEKKWESNRKRKSDRKGRNGIKKIISLKRISSDPELLNYRGLGMMKHNIAMDVNGRRFDTNLRRSVSDSRMSY